MKIAVIGLWHLGCVTAACLANARHKTIAYDPNVETIQKLRKAEAPLHEPRLNDLISSGIKSGNLQFTASLNDLVDVDIVWVAFDTPVDENDIADVDLVVNQIKTLIPFLKDNALIMISSQIPVGTTRRLQLMCSADWPQKKLTFAVSPENLRLGKAIDVFMQQERIIVGIQSEADKNRIASILNSFTENIIWMTIESAEMTKHALNAFLASSVVFINELSTLCEQVGADAKEVEVGLKSEARIGQKAYLRPGGAIGGGTLLRDVNYLIQIGRQQGQNTPFFSALLESNNLHKQWSLHKLLELIPNISGKTIALLGLTYKVGTDTLRRSTAIEMAQWLKKQGARVIAYDPVINHLPEQLHHSIELSSSMDHVLKDADAAILTTEWPQFALLSADQIAAAMKEPLIFDASGFLRNQLCNDERIKYFSVGK